MAKTKELTIECDEVTVKYTYVNGRVKAIIDSPDTDGLLGGLEWTDVVEYVKSETNKPDDVFDEEYLEKWAEENGYVKA